ncbi:MAG: sulfatase [Gemmatimonadaceae bacterium]
MTRRSAQQAITGKTIRSADVFAIAVWSAVGFGLLEGVVLCITRAFPALRAPYKVSPHILWVAPLVDLVLFLSAAGVVIAVSRMVWRSHGASHLRSVYGVFVFLGLFAVLSAPGVIHIPSAALLALGGALAIARKVNGTAAGVARSLRFAMILPPFAVAIGLGVAGYDRVREMWLFRQLPPAAERAFNVLVIVLDTVRRDSFDAGTETPNLDRFAAAGTTYENAWSSSSWSLPAQATVMTGAYAHRHGADWPGIKLSANVPTLAEFFAARGYKAGAFSGNASWVTPEHLGRGYLRFKVYRLEDLARRTSYGRVISRLVEPLGWHYAGRGKKASRLSEEFLDFVSDYPGRPFLAYLCYMDVNQRFHNASLNHAFWERKPSPREVRAAYDGGLRELDARIGSLFGELEARGVLGNTMVIVTSDHGESFGAETGDHDPKGHGTSLYPEQIGVPLFIVFPGRVAAGARVKETVSIRAIPATIAAALGLAESPFGPSLPLANAAGGPADAVVLSTLHYGQRDIESVVWNKWQYISTPATRQEELFDLETDPGARTNVLRENDAGAFRSRLKEALSVTDGEAFGIHKDAP